MTNVVNCLRVGVALSVLALCSACEAPPEPSSIRTNVEALASDALEGRMTGTPGIEQAAAHIVAELARLTKLAKGTRPKTRAAARIGEPGLEDGLRICRQRLDGIDGDHQVVAGKSGLCVSEKIAGFPA